MLYKTKFFSYSDIGKCLSFGVILRSVRNQCVISRLCLCLFYPSVSVEIILQGCFSAFSILHGCVPIASPKSLLLVFYLLLMSVYALLLRVLVFTLCRMDCEDENISTDLHVINGVTVLQRALVMMQIFVRSALVYLSVFICISFLRFTQNLERKCFTFLGISALSVLIYIKLMINKMLNITWFHILHIVLSSI